MTEPTNPAQRREFAARLRESQEQITADFIDYIDAGALTSAEQALAAARQEAKTGEATPATLMRLAEATMAAGRILEAAAKSCAAQAASTNQPIREAARRIKIGPATLSKWMEAEETDVAIPANTWWISADRAPEDNPGDAGTTNMASHPQAVDAAQEESFEGGEEDTNDQVPAQTTPQNDEPQNPHDPALEPVGEEPATDPGNTVPTQE